MDKLSEKRILPRTLFVDDINTDHNEIALADFGSVVKGQHHGRFVALKMLYKAPHKVSVCHQRLSDADLFGEGFTQRRFLS